jgi:hypothetical protein
MNGNDTARAATIAGLREIADFLEAHPGLPVPRYGLKIAVHAGTDTGAEDDAAGRAEVDAAATILGATPTTTVGGHYEVARAFAGGWQYEVLRIPAEAMRRHDAQQSYTRNLQVDAAPGQARDRAGYATPASV